MWSTWGARLSDTIDVPMQTPWKDLRSLGETCRILSPKLLGSTSPATFSAGTCHAQIPHSSVPGQQQVTFGKHHFKTKSPQVSAGPTKSSPSPHPPSLMRFPLFHRWAEQAWLVGLAWRQAEVHEQKAKFPTAEMLQDTTATISIIILNWCLPSCFLEITFKRKKIRRKMKQKKEDKKKRTDSFNHLQKIRGWPCAYLTIKIGSIMSTGCPTLIINHISQD